MNALADRIVRTVEEHSAHILQAPEPVLNAKPSAQRWSKKEILGHLVDSAQNNLQRLVRAQYQDTPRIVYEQDTWVALSRYQAYSIAELVTLWVCLNKHYAHVLRGLSESSRERLCDIGQKGPEIKPLRVVAEDYLTHMVHHLTQIAA